MVRTRQVSRFGGAMSGFSSTDIDRSYADGENGEAEARVILTLGQWSDVADLCTDALTNGRAGRLLSNEETAATLELLELIAGWQEYFRVDGDKAANERLVISLPVGLPFVVTGAHDAG